MSLTIFLSQSLFQNLSFTIFFSQSFFHNISFTIFFSQPFFHILSFTNFLSQSFFHNLHFQPPYSTYAKFRTHCCTLGYLFLLQSDATGGWIVSTGYRWHFTLYKFVASVYSFYIQLAFARWDVIRGYGGRCPWKLDCRKFGTDGVSKNRLTVFIS